MRWLPFLLLSACGGSGEIYPQNGIREFSVPDGTPYFLSWYSPIEYEDGSPLWNLAGFRIYANGQMISDIRDRGEVTAKIYADSGDVVWITAYDATGAESTPSNKETLP